MEDYQVENEEIESLFAVDLQDIEGRDPSRARFIKNYLKKALI